MEVKYQVFVSSTYEDLIEERDEVMKSLLELDCIPSGMELFPSSDDETFEYIKRVIDNCDYFILIIGGRYGSLHHSGKSFTQMEYEYAFSKNTPILAFLRSNPEQLPSNKFELSEDKRRKLNQFKSIIQRRLVRHWTSKGDLSAILSRSMIKLMKDKPQGGWIKNTENFQGPKSISESKMLGILEKLQENNNSLMSQLTKQPIEVRIEAQVPDRLELVITAITPSNSDDNNYAVVLADPNSNKRVPIIIGSYEAQGLAIELEKIKPNRPLTHRLFFDAITSMGYKIIEASIYGLINGIFYGKIVFSDQYNYLEVDSRISDMLTLAIIGVAPIYCNKDVFDKTAIEIDENSSNPEVE